MKHLYNKARLTWSLIGLAIVAAHAGSKYYIKTLKAQSEPLSTINTSSKAGRYSIIILDDSYFNNPQLDNQPLKFAKENFILLATEDINRDILFEGNSASLSLVIGSSLNHKVMHTIKSITAQSLPISSLLKAFFSLENSYSHLYIIKDLYGCSKSNPSHLISTFIECNDDKGIILTECASNNKAYKAEWNNNTEELSSWIPLSLEEKNIMQKNLLREYVGVRV